MKYMNMTGKMPIPLDKMMQKLESPIDRRAKELRDFGERAIWLGAVESV